MFLKVGVKPYKYLIKRNDKNSLKGLKTFGNFNVKKDIQYVDDNNFEHQLDIYYPINNSNGITLLYIHGGGYVYGYKENSIHFTSYFVNSGYTVIVMNYRLANFRNGITLKEQVHDVFYCLDFIRKNRIRFNLNIDRFAVMGDSAEGHLSLLTNIIYHDDEAQKFFAINRLPDIHIKCYALNSPMFDYSKVIQMAKKYFNKRGLRDLFSKQYNDKYYVQMNSPSYYFEKNLSLEPMFVSTSLLDMYKEQSESLYESAKRLNYQIDYLFENSSNKKIGHVYNHFVFVDEGEKCNRQMMTFINRYCS